MEFSDAIPRGRRRSPRQEGIPTMEINQAKQWEKTRRWGFGIFCIPRISALFLAISAIDYVLVGRDWKLLVGELRENFLVAALAGIIFSIIDWRRQENRYRRFLMDHPDSENNGGC
jgi:hypothetical protein